MHIARIKHITSYVLLQLSADPLVWLGQFPGSGYPTGYPVTDVVRQYRLARFKARKL